ncbi:hypothetical protein OG394_11220 [Kribbella sp. NBC_01245]|uniref:hypothetical protein n=1 Tax=Kribbella sp. NBC_01245 TaxID=2903578 RepID=UPI002E2BEB2E|nr:hypothetical protein [Kribbella sp. NBC_01245]
MRDNGLTASSYAEMGEVEPSITDAVLSALAEAGIAAYAEQVEPGEASRRAMDRLYVDEASAERAGVVIARSSEDAEWQALVAQFDEAPATDSASETGEAGTATVPRWPAIEDLDIEIDRSEPVRISDDQPEPEPKPRVADAKDPHEHYIPPEPPRGPRLDWISRLAWTGVIGGPLVLVLVALLDIGSGSRLTLLGALGFAAGFLTLVIRMKDRLPADEGGDDGAVV